MDIHTDSMQITHALLKLIAEVDEFKGAWRALGQIAPERLSSLKRVATIESIGSSTRIEGSKLTDSQVDALLKNLRIKSFSSRDEQEVAGYAQVMDIIFEHHETIPLSENYIRQLHRELLEHSEKDNWHRGNYKNSPNHVEAFADGKSLGVVFETATPFDTPLRMRDLIAWTSNALTENNLHPLLIVAVFVVTFLAIHPFQDGNGRLSRVMTTFLLLKTGYAYVPYSSMEAVIEQNKESYYLALRKTQGTLQSAAPDWQPWLLFFLKAVKSQTERLRIKMDREQVLIANLPALSLQILELIKSQGRITNSEVVMLTEANRNTVKKHLETLVAAKHIQRNGKGKSTWYSLLSS